ISVPPHSRLRADSGEALLEWAIAGAGIAELPSFLLGDAMEQRLLVPLLLDFTLPEYGIHVVRPPGTHVPGKVRVFIDAMVEHFGGEPSWDRCMMAALAREGRAPMLA